MKDRALERPENPQHLAEQLSPCLRAASWSMDQRFDGLEWVL
jgi:hypothetical protein